MSSTWCLSSQTHSARLRADEGAVGRGRGWVRAGTWRQMVEALFWEYGGQEEGEGTVSKLGVCGKLET